MQTLYTPLENGPYLGLSSLYPVILNIGWFAIQWRVQPYTAHISAVQLNMSLDSGSMKKTSRRSSSLHTK